MTFKTLGLLLALAMLGAMALPAGAAPTDAGVFSAVATVGEQNDPLNPCSPDGDGPVSGDGLTLLDDDTKAYWMIDAANSATSLARLAAGSVKLCGELEPSVTSPAQVGASCLSTHGLNGQGVAVFPTDTVQLTDISWTASALGTFVVTGKADGGQNLTAVVQALDEAVILNCLGSVGATRFTVAAVYTIA